MVSALTGEVALQVCSEGDSKFARGCRESRSLMISLKHMVLMRVVVRNLTTIERSSFLQKREAMSKKRMGMTEVYFALHLTTGFDRQKRCLR